MFEVLGLLVQIAFRTVIAMLFFFGLCVWLFKILDWLL